MRKFTRSALVAWAMAAGSAGAYGQQAALPTLPNAAQVLQEGVALHDKGDYAGAIAKYLTVTSGDSSYAAVQSELALTYLANKQYKEAAATCRRAMALHLNRAKPYDILATAEEEQGNVPEALRIYTEGLQRFPYNQDLWYNQGVTQQQSDRFAEAQASFQRSLQLRPTHAGSHLLLGMTAARQGHTAHAMLGLMTFLAILPESERSNSVLFTLEQLASNGLEIEEKERIKPFSPNAPFQELDQLLNAKVALRKDYTSKVKFDANLVKQVQLLVEKFPATDAAEQDFWLQAYSPLITALRRDDNLTAFTYLILSSANDKKASQWVKANRKTVDRMVAACGEALNELRAYQQVQRNGQTTRVQAWFGDSGELNGLGSAERKDGKLHLHGPWQFVDDEGYVSGEGNFSDAGEKTGAWRTYYANGKLEKLAEYDAAGLLTGTYKEYFDNGELSIEGAYRQGKPEGPAKLYYYCGVVRELRPYQNGDINGEAVFYYPDGKVQRRATYKADKREGPDTYYYPNGNVEARYVYAADQQHGPFEVFSAENKLEKKGTYDHGELHGAYTYYHPNGQVGSTGTYEHGKRSGVWHEFYANGKPSLDASYNTTGQLHGPYVDYDEDGVRYAEMLYEQDRAVRTAYFDKAGKPVAQTNVAKKGKTTVQGYRPDGSSRSAGTYLNGDMEGEWRWFYRDGTPSTVRQFAHGQPNGVQEEYYATGQLRSRQVFRNGEPDGYYEAFYLDGQRQRTGFFQQGQREGQWHNYYPDGRLKRDYSFLHGEANGQTLTYSPGGQLTQARQYLQDRLVELTAYDSTGAVVNHVELTPALKSYALTYPGGKPLLKTDLTCFEETGNVTWWAPGGQTEQTTATYRDQRNGATRSYHPNGKVAMEGQYRNGQPDGEWKYYYPSGTLRSTGHYQNGEEEGEWVSYNEEGKLENRSQYKEGERQGTMLMYNRMGELLVEKTYEGGLPVSYRVPGADDKPTGPYLPISAATTIKTTFANGKPALEETYRKSYYEGVRTYYYSTGQVYRRAENRNGVLTGKLVTYYPDGKLQEEEYYLHDELHGRSRYYRPDGTLEREETYRYGEKYGPTTYYDAKGKPTKTVTYWDTYEYESK